MEMVRLEEMLQLPEAVFLCVLIWNEEATFLKQNTLFWLLHLI